MNISEELITTLKKLGIKEGITLEEAYKKIIEHCEMCYDEICDKCNINPFQIIQYIDFLKICNCRVIIFDLGKIIISKLLSENLTTKN